MRLLILRVCSRLLDAIRFVHEGTYCNLSRAPPSLFRYENSKVYFVNTPSDPVNAKRIPCFIMPGLLESCNVRRPLVTTWEGESTSVRQIRLFCFSQEFENAMAALGQILGSAELLMKFQGGTLGFASKKSSASNGMWSVMSFLPALKRIARQPIRHLLTKSVLVHLLCSTGKPPQLRPSHPRPPAAPYTPSPRLLKTTVSACLSFHPSRC